MSIRAQQIASTIRRAVQESIARGVHDPRIRGLVSITRVNVTDDLSEAFVHVSVLPADRAELTLHGLQSAAPKIRTAIGRKIRLRTMPRLSFRLDESLKKQAALEAAIRKTPPGQPVLDDDEQLSDAEDQPR